jgi:hypothetical protein
VAFSQTASAQDAVFQKLEASFACPSQAYDETEPVNYSLQYLDQYKWEGDLTTFKVRVDRQSTISGTSSGAQTTRAISVVSAKFSDIGEVVIAEDGDGDALDVAIHCKGKQECVTSKAAGRSANNDDFQTSKLSFHMCSESVAKEVKAALQKMIGN